MLVGVNKLPLLFLAPTLLVAPTLLFSQQPPRIVSPEVHPDRTITFRLRGPELATAAVRHPWEKEPTPMKKGEDGVWSATVGPVEPQIYSYTYVLDGVRVVDPHNPRVKLWAGGATSLVEVRGETPAAYDLTDVPHGDLHVHYFRSSAVERQRRLFVYTPPGYRSSDKRYPTLYLLHGSGDDETTWSEGGKANLILDNLIAWGKAEPMLVVMTNGHPVPYGQRSRGVSGRNTELFVDELTNDVLPLIESRYRVKKGRDHRAVAGLSMGGGQALAAGLGHPDLFAWTGAFSSAVFDPEENPAFAKFLADPEKANRETRLLWIAIGKDDFLLERNEKFRKLLVEHGIEHEYRLTGGGHSWPVWMGYLEELAPRLFQPQE